MGWEEQGEIIMEGDRNDTWLIPFLKARVGEFLQNQRLTCSWGSIYLFSWGEGEYGGEVLHDIMRQRVDKNDSLTSQSGTRTGGSFPFLPALGWRFQARLGVKMCGSNIHDSMLPAEDSRKMKLLSKGLLIPRESDWDEVLHEQDCGASQSTLHHRQCA